MPGAKIVYNGVGGGGDLFAGKKFYLLQRIPSRDKWKDLITSNGGVIVIAETQADIMIADHARAHQPVGSLSWTFIEQSVKKGELQDIESHRAGPATKVAQDVASIQPARQGRTAFTAEDDRILAEWCVKAERQGVSMKGNKIYQQLEEQNPRHSFHSWRDRWIKHLDHLPRPTLQDGSDEDDEQDRLRPVKGKLAANIPTRTKNLPSPAVSKAAPRTPTQRTSSHRASELRPAIHPESVRHEPVRVEKTKRSTMNDGSARRDTPQRISVQPIKSSPGSSHSRASLQAVKANGNSFVEEETKKLVEMHDDILTVADDRMIDFWLQWATENDEHTAQEWCNHFKEYVVPLIKSKGERKERKGKSKEISPSLPETPVRVGTIKAGSSKSVPRRLIEVEDSQDTFTIQPSQSYRGDKIVHPYALDEKAFEEDIMELAERLGVNIDLNLTISNRSISLFDLWKVFISDEFNGFKAVDERNLWPNVASRLGLSPKRYPAASEALQTQFKELEAIFAGFEALVRNPEDSEDSEEDPDLHESSLLAAQLLETVNYEIGFTDVGEKYDDDLDSPQFSSPQVQKVSASRKRGLKGSGSSPHSKRQRMDKGKRKELEIPSTPEDNINQQTFRPVHKGSPLKRASVPGDEGDSDEEFLEDEEELFVSADSRESVTKRMPKPRNLEPETQDFHFPDHKPESNAEDLSPELSSSPPPPLLAQVDQSQSSNAATRGSVHSTNMEDSSTQSQTESQKQAQLIDFINDIVAKGYPQEIVIQALEATTMELGPNVEKVAESLTVDELIPNNVKGVWHAWDDDALKDGAESKEYRHILLKHGSHRIKERRKFLAALAKESEGR